MKSMTGYGEGSQNVRGIKITVQIRSLNHRHLDMQLRVPREYLSFEEDDTQSDSRKNRAWKNRFIRQSIWRQTPGQKIGNGRRPGRAIHRRAEAAQKKISSWGRGRRFDADSYPDLFHVREVEADHGGEREALLKALARRSTKLEARASAKVAQLKSDMESDRSST